MIHEEREMIASSKEHVILGVEKSSSKCNHFPQSLLSTKQYPSLVSMSENKHTTIRPAYTVEQIKLHNYIDFLLSTMNPCLLGVPQLCRSQARDVHKLIYGIGKFMNSSNKNCIFKNTDIDTQYTLQKLNLLQFSLIKYCNTKLPNDKLIKAHCEDLHSRLQAAINHVKKKSHTHKCTFRAILGDSEYFIEKR